MYLRFLAGRIVARMYMPYLMGGYAVTVILMLVGCYAISRTVRGLRGLRLLVWGLACALVAIVLIALRTIAPPWITILAAHTAAFVCWLLLYCATTEILDVAAPFFRWGLGILVASPAAMFWFTYVHDSLTARIYIITATFAIFAGARAAVLFAYWEPPDPGTDGVTLRSLVTALGWLQVFMVAVQVFRLFLTAMYPPRTIMQMDMIQAAFTYLNLILNAGAGFGLTWLALAVHRRELHRMAQTDSLTGLLNRRAFEEILGRELHRASRKERPLSILLIDIDRFKEVNDTWGHQEGDKVIRQVASTLHSTLRPGDALSRFGGEEFMVLLREATPEQSEEIAGRLRARIANLVGLRCGRLTVSIGMASSCPTDDAGELLRRCDEAMYRSKRAGRNLVTVDRSASSRTATAQAFPAEAIRNM